jgi:hypothetical protein
MVDTNPVRQSNKRFAEKLKHNIKKGALHKQLGIKEGKTIPESKLESLKNSKNPQTRKRANFALNARHWAKK